MKINGAAFVVATAAFLACEDPPLNQQPIVDDGGAGGDVGANADMGPDGAPVGETCKEDEECAGELVCEEERCTEPDNDGDGGQGGSGGDGGGSSDGCDGDEDCPEDQICVGAPDGRCIDRPGDPNGCGEDRSCPDGQHCNDDGTCRDGDSDCEPDCAEGELCLGGQCGDGCTNELQQEDPDQWLEQCCDGGELCCLCDGADLGRPDLEANCGPLECATECACTQPGFRAGAFSLSDDPDKYAGCDTLEELAACPCDCEAEGTCTIAEVLSACGPREEGCSCKENPHLPPNNCSEEQIVNLCDCSCGRLWGCGPDDVPLDENGEACSPENVCACIAEPGTLQPEFCSAEQLEDLCSCTCATPWGCAADEEPVDRPCGPQPCECLADPDSQATDNCSDRERRALCDCVCEPEEEWQRDRCTAEQFQLACVEEVDCECATNPGSAVTDNCSDAQRRALCECTCEQQDRCTPEQLEAVLPACEAECACIADPLAPPSHCSEDERAEHCACTCATPWGCADGEEPADGPCERPRECECADLLACNLEDQDDMQTVIECPCNCLLPDTCSDEPRVFQDRCLVDNPSAQSSHGRIWWRICGDAFRRRGQECGWRYDRIAVTCADRASFSAAWHWGASPGDNPRPPPGGERDIQARTVDGLLRWECNDGVWLVAEILGEGPRNRNICIRFEDAEFATDCLQNLMPWGDDPDYGSFPGDIRYESTAPEADCRFPQSPIRDDQELCSPD